MEVIRITNTEQLNLFLSSRKQTRFVFEFDAFSEEGNQEWVARIRKNYFACGCNVGMHFLMGSLFLVLLTLALNYFFFHMPIHYSLYACAMLFVFVMAAVGKMVGKGIARLKLQEDVKILKGELKQTVCAAVDVKTKS